MNPGRPVSSTHVPNNGEFPAPESTGLGYMTMYATMALSQLAASREINELIAYLDSLPLNGLASIHHKLFWQSGFPCALLDVILDRTWYQSFANDGLDPDSPVSTLSRQSRSVLKLLQRSILRLNDMLLSSEDFLENETLAQRIHLVLERIPLLFELLWQYRHIVFRTARLETNGTGDEVSMLSDVQALVARYCNVYGCAFLNSPSQVPPFGFVIHIGIYCWYHSSDLERKQNGLPHYVTVILNETIVDTPEKCRAFATEIIYPVLGESPTNALSRVLRKDQFLTDTSLLKITIDLMAQFIALCPSAIVKDVRDAEVLLMTLATVAQRHICQCHESVEYNVPEEHRELPEKCSQISMSIFHIIWCLSGQLGVDEIRHVITKRFNYLNFLPQMQRCIALVHRIDDTLVLDCIAFFVRIYRSIGDQAQRGQLTQAKSADYRHFRHVLQVYWQPVIDELQPSGSTSDPLLRQATRLRNFRTQWQKLAEMYELGREEDPAGGFWSEREMIGCFNVRCPCYGLKPLHKLRECKRCRTAHYCNKECQKKDWDARHRFICSHS